MGIIYNINIPEKTTNIRLNRHTHLLAHAWGSSATAAAATSKALSPTCRPIFEEQHDFTVLFLMLSSIEPAQPHRQSAGKWSKWQQHKTSFQMFFSSNEYFSIPMQNTPKKLKHDVWANDYSWANMCVLRLGERKLRKTGQVAFSSVVM